MADPVATAPSRRRPKMDVKTMYPNFHAEQYKHHVQENSIMSVFCKRQEGSSGNRRAGQPSLWNGAGTRPPSRNGLLLHMNKRDDYRQNAEALSSRHCEVSTAERSRGDKQGIPPIAPIPSSNQQENVSTTQKNTREVAGLGLLGPPLRPPSRQVAIRGELSLTSPAAWEDGNKGSAGTIGISPRLRPLTLAPTFAGSVKSLLEASAGTLSATEAESLQDLVINARPRTRYARRELYRQGSTPALGRISTAPTTLLGHSPLDGIAVTARDASLLTSSRSTGTLQTARITARWNQRPPSRQGFPSGVLNAIEAVFPGTEVEDTQDDHDDTNFFLTELEAAARAASAAAVARLCALARHIALGSFLLYGNPPAFVAAIQHFTTALKTVEAAQTTFSDPDWPAMALMSLLHHHRGVALREIVVASASSTSKAAVACIKHAFAAQRRALKLAQRANDRRLQARALKALGLLLLDVHSYGPALTHQQEALQHALEEKDRELEARVYANLGNLALAQLHFGHALSSHQRDLDLCSSKVLDCRLGRARAHRNLSIVFAKLHRRDQQIKHEREARGADQKDGGAYLYDVANHPNSSVGNICLQSSTPIDPALVDRVTQDLAEIVRGLSAQLKNGVEKDDSSSITAALEQEWSTTEIDLEAALAAIAENVDTPATKSEKGSLHTSPVKSPIGVSRHVSVRIDNYSSARTLAQPASLNQEP